MSSLSLLPFSSSVFPLAAMMTLGQKKVQVQTPLTLQTPSLFFGREVGEGCFCRPVFTLSFSAAQLPATTDQAKGGGNLGQGWEGGREEGGKRRGRAAADFPVCSFVYTAQMTTTTEKEKERGGDRSDGGSEFLVWKGWPGGGGWSRVRAEIKEKRKPSSSQKGEDRDNRFLSVRHC